jgi:hypothetical protein
MTGQSLTRSPATHTANELLSLTPSSRIAGLQRSKPRRTDPLLRLTKHSFEFTGGSQHRASDMTISLPRPTRREPYI